MSEYETYRSLKAKQQLDQDLVTKLMQPITGKSVRYITPPAKPSCINESYYIGDTITKYDEPRCTYFLNCKNADCDFYQDYTKYKNAKLVAETTQKQLYQIPVFQRAYFWLKQRKESLATDFAILRQLQNMKQNA